MSYITGSIQQFTASFEVPNSWDPIKYTSVGTPFRALADRTAFLSASKANLSGSNYFPSTNKNYFSGSNSFSGSVEFSGSVLQTTKTVTRIVSPHKAYISGSHGSNGTLLYPSTPLYVYTTNVSGQFYFPLDEVLVNGCTITNYEFEYFNQGSNVTTSSLCCGTFGSTGITTLSTKVHVSGSSYQTHTYSGGTVVVDRTTKNYYVCFEVGALTATYYAGPSQLKLTYTMSSALEPAG